MHSCYAMGETCARLTGVVDLSGAGVDGLQQLVNLLVCHLLAQVREDVLELADSDKARHVLVEHLETAAVLVGLARVTETARPVQNALEGLEVDCYLKRFVSRYILLKRAVISRD